jgi:probable rRNA maturation factor
LARLPEIGVVVVSDARIAQIHAEFMNIEGPTDVITFAHGEIIISAEMARACASDYGHPVEHELALYTVHGLLHLNGFDDLSPVPAARMRRTQTRVLKRILSQLPSL